MWSSIRGIILAISPRQRLIALSLLLITIVVVTIGPKVASGLSPSNGEMERELLIQRHRVRTLMLENDTLTHRIRLQSEECTDDLYQQTLEFKRRLRELAGIIKEHEDSHTPFERVQMTIFPDTVFGRGMRDEPVRDTHQNPALKRINQIVRELDRN